jgi:hypothetical protein
MNMKRIDLVVLCLTVLMLTGAAQAEDKTSKASKAVPTKTVKVSKEVPAPVVAPASRPVESKAPVAEQKPVDPEDMSAMISAIIDAAKSGKWLFAVGFIIMLLVSGVKKLFKDKIPSDFLPWMSGLLGALSASLFAISTGANWKYAIVTGLEAGLIASGMYSAIGKRLEKLIPQKKAEEAK